MPAVRIKKTDIIFIFSLLFCAVVYSFYILKTPGYVDEAFYPTIALRLLNGDSLVADEWHLSQFSSLFMCLPVKAAIALKGSTDGIILLLRSLYLCIHTGAAAGIYAFFRKKGPWAIAASLLFYLQTPMWIMNLSYNSLFALFIIATGLLLLTICSKQKTIYYVLAGITYACACVCNPFFCVIFFIYTFILLIIRYRTSDFHRKNIALSNKSRQKNNKKPRKYPEAKPEHDFFFSNKAFLLFFCGICSIAIVSIVFFFATGGTLQAFADNFKHLLTDSEHQNLDSPIIIAVYKAKEMVKGFHTVSYGLSFLPALLFAAIAADKKRTDCKHKTVFALLGFAVSAFYLVCFAINLLHNGASVFVYSLPLTLLCVLSYILTQHKNKKLFYCFWLPGFLATLSQIMASNLLAEAPAWGLAITNIAGVFFVRDFVHELKTEEPECKFVLKKIAAAAICLFICLQLALQGTAVVRIATTNTENAAKIESGPYENLYIEKRLIGTFNLSLADLDEIKQKSSEDDPVLILSDMTWLYLYIDRPFGTYSAWQLSFEPERLEAYYELNPEKKPKYIYISAVIPRSDYGVSFKMAEEKAAVMKEMFNCKQEKLSRGILLTVLE